MSMHKKTGKGGKLQRVKDTPQKSPRDESSINKTRTKRKKLSG